MLPELSSPRLLLPPVSSLLPPQHSCFRSTLSDNYNFVSILFAPPPLSAVHFYQLPVLCLAHPGLHVSSACGSLSVYQRYFSHEPSHSCTSSSHSQTAIPLTVKPQPNGQHPVLFPALVHIKPVHFSIVLTRNPDTPCPNQ